MDSEVKIYIERADNEILLAKINFEISTINKIKETLNIGLDKTFFNNVTSGVLNKQLLDIYETESWKADVLLDIFFKEKKKRGTFTYNMKSEANIPAAQESIDNARIFVSLIKKIIEGSQ